MTSNCSEASLYEDGLWTLVVSPGERYVANFLLYQVLKMNKEKGRSCHPADHKLQVIDFEFNLVEQLVCNHRCFTESIQLFQNCTINLESLDYCFIHCSEKFESSSLFSAVLERSWCLRDPEDSWELVVISKPNVPLYRANSRLSEILRNNITKGQTLYRENDENQLVKFKSSVVKELVKTNVKEYLKAQRDFHELKNLPIPTMESVQYCVLLWSCEMSLLEEETMFQFIHCLAKKHLRSPMIYKDDENLQRLIVIMDDDQHGITAQLFEIVKKGVSGGKEFYFDNRLHGVVRFNKKAIRKLVEKNMLKSGAESKNQSI